ncbi:MAG: hypothetical protein ACRDR6_02060 [Pseudonocardiaceae bacterium]
MGALAHRQADKATIRRWPRFAKASSRLAVAVATLLEAAEWGEDVRLSDVLEMIDALVARPELRAALAEVTGTVPPPDADDDGRWRAEMASRYPTVAGLVKTLTSVITFGANTRVQRCWRRCAHCGVEAAGVRPSRARRRAGRPQRLRVLRT